MMETKYTLEELIEELFPDRQLDEETRKLLSPLTKVAGLLRVMPEDTAELAFDATVAVARATKSEECVEKVTEIIGRYRPHTLSIILSGIKDVIENKPPEAVVKHLEILDSSPVKEFISLVEKKEHPEIAKEVIEDFGRLIILRPEEGFISSVLQALRNYKGRILQRLALEFHFLILRGDETGALRAARALAKDEIARAINKYGINENFVDYYFHIACDRINGERLLSITSHLLTQQDYDPYVATQIFYRLRSIADVLDALGLGEEGLKIYERICGILGKHSDGLKVERVATMIDYALTKYGMSKKFLELLGALEEGKPPEKVAKKHGYSYLFS
jgi:hypothetical protein